MLTILFFLFILGLLASLPVLKQELFRIRLEKAKNREFKYFDGQRANTLEKYYVVNNKNILANIWGIGVLFGHWPYDLDIRQKFTILELLPPKWSLAPDYTEPTTLRYQDFKRIDFSWRDYRADEEAVAHAFLVNENSINAKRILLREFEKHVKSRSKLLTFRPIWV